MKYKTFICDIDETEYEAVQEELKKESYQKDITVEQYKERLSELEKLIMLLMKQNMKRFTKRHYS